MRRPPLLLLAAVLGGLVLTLAGCDPEKALDDDAACPGESCTDDTRARFEAIAALDGVTEVESVARSYGLDDGSSREATVRASVADRIEARALLLRVLRELEDWPEHDSGTASATVTADPEVVVDYRSRRELELLPGQFDGCSGAECDAALDKVRDRSVEAYDGVDLSLEVRDGVLRADATTTPEQVNLVSAAIRAAVIEVGVRVAERAIVDVRAEGPLTMTLRLDDGLVCEQPPGMHVLCEPDDPDAVPFEDALARASSSSGNS